MFSDWTKSPVAAGVAAAFQILMLLTGEVTTFRVVMMVLCIIWFLYSLRESDD